MRKKLNNKERRK